MLDTRSGDDLGKVKMNLLWEFLLFLFVPHIGCHGQVLNCYKCASGVSWRECAYKQHETKCSKENDKCMTVEFRGKYGETGFVRDCVRELTCAKEELILCEHAEQCDFTCCSGDLCNSATALNRQASSVVLMTCVFSLLFWLKN